MTTFSYRLTLGDGEAISAHAALTHYIEFCEKKLEEAEQNGTTMAPYFARKSHCENILTRLFSNINMTSTNNFS